jgi:hypothetical protein
MAEEKGRHWLSCPKQDWLMERMAGIQILEYLQNKRKNG